MKNFLIVMLLTFTCLSCDSIKNGSTERYFYTSAQLSPPEENVGMYVKWESGDKTIFRYVLTHPDDEDIADDELSEVFWIEIPSDITEFQLETEDLNTDSGIEVYYTRSCFCGFEAFQLSEVDLSGTKKDNGTWEVSFEITALLPTDQSEYYLKDDGVYIQNTFDW